MEVIRLSRAKLGRWVGSGWLLAHGLVGVSACAGLTASAAEPEAEPARIELRDDLLSVRVGRLPLAEVLSKIGEQAGIAVAVAGDPGAVRPQRFDDLPLADAVRRLVGDQHGLLMIYHPAGGNEEGASLREIRVYANLRDRDSAAAEVTAQRTDAANPPLAEERSERLAEIHELLRQRDEPAVSRLTTYLARDPDPDVRRVAAGALTSIGGDDAAASLELALDDQDPVVRLQAARSLRAVRGADAAEELIKLASEDQDSEVRRTAILLLSHLETPRVAETLQRALSDSAPEVREAAAQVLGRDR